MPSTSPPEASAPGPVPAKPASTASILAGVAVGLMTGGKAPLWIAAALATSACVVGTLGVVVIRDWQASIATAATEGCRLADLQAAEASRDATQGRYDALARDMAATADRLRADAAARVAQVQAVLDAERRKPASVKTCTVDLRALKGVR